MIFSLLTFLICLVVFGVHQRWQSTRHKTTAAQQFNLVPILCFHDLDGPGPYALTNAEFRYYLNEIRRSGVRVIPLRKLLEHARGNRLFREPSIVITIDDDYKNIVRVAAPMLREFRYPATFFFYTRDIQKNPRYGTSYHDLRRLHKEGFEIQNHSYSHTIFHVANAGESDTVYAARVHREVVQSRNRLEAEIPGLHIYAFAYPMGFYSSTIRAKLKAEGYQVALTTDAHPVDLTRKFNFRFDRYTIQKKYIKDPEEMFRQQIQYALRPFQPEDMAAREHPDE